VRAPRTAGFGASTQSLVDDRLDGARASAAFGAATEAAINLLGAAREIRRTDGTADIVVGEDVTGTNNHGSGRSRGDATATMTQILKSATGCKRKSRLFKLFQTDPDTRWNALAGFDSARSVAVARRRWSGPTIPIARFFAPFARTDCAPQKCLIVAGFGAEYGNCVH